MRNHPLLDDPEFKKGLDDLWKKYLRHCKETGVKPTTFERFKERVEIEAVRMIASQLIDKAQTKYAGEDHYYMAIRRKDLPQPHGEAVIRHCMQCKEEIWVDTTLVKKAEGATGIICHRCISELENKSPEEIVTETIGKLRDDK